MVSLTPKELSDIEEAMKAGKLPPDTLKQHFEDEAKNVFGVDAKRDRKGNYIEQGIGARGYETANHFAAILRAETLGQEPKGSYQAAIREIWKRDPKRAEKLRLPQPQKEEKAA